MASPHLSDLPSELRSLVKWSVALLGEVIREELGEPAYRRIETIRRKMAAIRTASPETKARGLEETFSRLEKLSGQERREFARSYTLMFELMNACESAYRTHRLRQRKAHGAHVPLTAERIFYVLTAHPTEARAPDNIEIFHQIQAVLVTALERGIHENEKRLRSLLEIAWSVGVVRFRKPRVEDEAEHVYSVALRDENLSEILDYVAAEIPIYLRSWVGGDKDGHPGVDARAMRASLQLSRNLLHQYAEARARETLHLEGLLFPERRERLAGGGSGFLQALRKLRRLGNGDGPKVQALHRALQIWIGVYRKEIGEPPLPLARLGRFLKVFPGLVVPLELREDSSVLMSDPSGRKLAIGKMLRALREVSGPGDERWYARGMIISMASSAEHVRVATEMVRKSLGRVRIRIVPLFEQRKALETGHLVLGEIFKDPKLRKLVRGPWDRRFEVMLGYSDSSKESGVLKSRLAVVDAMERIDRACAKAKVRPVFFHGSGGSIDRGGGSVTEQMAPWPKSALTTYKATIQGEMVERTFASPEIIRSRLEQIAHARRPGAALRAPKSSPTLEDFADRAAKEYALTIASPRFLRMVEHATPYRYLSALKIGSRPSKRGGSLSVPALRAIPWVLCWTQTRVLFQTWWGIGTAWKSTSAKDRAVLRREFEMNPLFRSFVQALGFTLAKIELPVWEVYLASSALPKEEVEYFRARFREELAGTQAFFRGVTGKSNPLWFRPWLGKSIELRASMIHPLNLLEILAQRDEDLPLLRICVTGIASGMLTTG